MKPEEIKELLADSNPTAILFDGLDAALVGHGGQYTRGPLAIYSVKKMLDVFMEQGMTEEEAYEYYEFNVACLWAGENTPIIMEDL